MPSLPRHSREGGNSAAFLRRWAKKRDSRLRGNDGWWASFLIALTLASPATAQTVTTSAAPQSVAVTIYRAPNRDAATPINLQWLNGYALISETRRIEIPAGEADIRFEGVAGGIIPESAIVTGLPEGVSEKNQDAFLLSPASLLERSLGRRVHIRRTSPGSGETKEHEAIIRSGPQGAVVLQTPDGLEALRCTGLDETIVYPSVPLGLSVKPTLSVRTRSTRATTATVTLSYLATGFDWQANYVATLAPSEDRMELFAWVTLANSDETGFENASTQTVAGTVKREYYEPGVRPRREALNIRCWPEATTSDIQTRSMFGGPPPPPPPPPPAPAMMAVSAQEITVTGSRISRKAVQEELGDLKLYRIPDPVTVAANSQKQVAMLEKDDVRVEVIYRQMIYAGAPELAAPPMRVLVTRNRTAEGLGLPLPAGRLILFGAGARRPILLGEGFVDDRAVGEEVEIELGPATGIFSRIVSNEAGGGMQLVVTNDRSVPAIFEGEFIDSDSRISTRAKLFRRDGRSVWRVIVPPNGTAKLSYSASR